MDGEATEAAAAAAAAAADAAAETAETAETVAGLDGHLRYLFTWHFLVDTLGMDIHLAPGETPDTFTTAAALVVAAQSCAADDQPAVMTIGRVTQFVYMHDDFPFIMNAIRESASLRARRNL